MQRGEGGVGCGSGPPKGGQPALPASRNRSGCRVCQASAAEEEEVCRSESPSRRGEEAGDQGVGPCEARLECARKGRGQPCAWNLAVRGERDGGAARGDPLLPVPSCRSGQGRQVPLVGLPDKEATDKEPRELPGREDPGARAGGLEEEEGWQVRGRCSWGDSELLHRRGDRGYGKVSCGESVWGGRARGSMPVLLPSTPASPRCEQIALEYRRDKCGESGGLPGTRLEQVPPAGCQERG
mmetsp:Transcript_4473/g.7790  ORF Transcript_4473/g.7790 Transcript_4473/m.7790 type:complete len:240 (+) Transcript_4473:105-824(+)